MSYCSETSRHESVKPLHLFPSHRAGCAGEDWTSAASLTSGHSEHSKRLFANVITSNHRHDLLYNISDAMCALEELFLIAQYDVLVPQSTIVGAIVC